MTESFLLQDEKSEYKRLFDRYDTDGNGHIDIHEFKLMIKDRESSRNLPKYVIKKIFKMSDEDNNGQIEYEEFEKMMQNPDLEYIFRKYLRNYMRYIVPTNQLQRVGLDETDGGQYEDEYKCCPPKLGMITISIIIIALFIIDEANQTNSTLNGTGVTARALIFDPHKKEEIWRYLTYMFVHVGFLHLGVNLFVQLLLGIPLEMVHGWWRVLTTYFCGVVAGSLATAVTDANTLLAGASGGVYSLITAQIASIIMNWNEMLVPATQLLIFVVIISVDVGTSFYNRYFSDTEPDQLIGYVAHFAGAVAGLLVGINILRNLRYTKKEKYIWWAATILFSILMTILIFLNAFNVSF